MPVVPGPKPHPLFGHLAEFRADRLAFFTRCARTYGDVVALRLPGRRALLLSHPDLIEEVLVTRHANFIKHFGLRMFKPVLGNGLVTSEGAFWRRQRKLSAPAFQAARLAKYAEVFVSSASRLLEAWQRDAARANDGHVRDVHDDFMRLTLEAACQALLGAEAAPDAEAVGTAIHVALEAIGVRFSRLLPIPEWFPAPSHLRLRALRSLNDMVAGLIASRRAAGGGDDLLATLVAARDDAGSAMTDAQLLDEVRTMFLAGHETTALALTYTLYLLATNPTVQERLQAELSTVLGGRLPNYGDLPRLAFARSVVTESMRLYPPADVLGREPLEDCTIGGFDVRKGTTLFMSQWVMHRDPRFFQGPETFDPARWTTAFEQSLPRFAYFPFGGGPRFCIGQNFAIAEAVLVLATLCQRCHFTPDPTFTLKLWPSLTLRPLRGVRVVVHAAK